jgi:hypothetical protein
MIMRFAFWLTVLTVVAVVVRLLRSQARAGGSSVTDDMVHQIERQGTLRVEEREPLDIDDVRAEEDSFWSETWDEPEEI